MGNNKLDMIARIILGLAFLIFGLNGFLNFMPMGEAAQPMMDLFAAVMATGYLFGLVKIVEIVIGLMFLANKGTNLATVISGVLTFNFVLVHAFLDVANIAIALVTFLLTLYLVCNRWDKLKVLLE